MRICKEHWDMCRAAIEERDLSSLVAKGGEAAMDRMVDELHGTEDKKTFDPLMSLNWHFSGEAMRCGGLYIMGQNETGDNDGHYCPICEFVKNSSGFVAKDAIGMIADQMRDHARETGLIPGLS